MSDEIHDRARQQAVALWERITRGGISYIDVITQSLEAFVDRETASLRERLNEEQLVHEKIGHVLLPHVGTPDGTSLGAAKEAATQMYSLRERAETAESELAAAKEREGRIREAIANVETARTFWHESFGVPISHEHANFMQAIGKLLDLAASTHSGEGGEKVT